MGKPDYLSKYTFDWANMKAMFKGMSSLDTKLYFPEIKNQDDANKFLKDYGFDPFDPVQNAELFGNFQEAMQFVRRHFLKSGEDDEGLDLNIPNVFYMITDIRDLLMIATGNSHLTSNTGDVIWAGIILKVMHTIIHADKDLRYRYFPIIQQQILDRIYKYLVRDEDNNLFLGTSIDDPHKVPLNDFQIKAKKTRDSIIVKLLCKMENVAEELFDRIGVRFITHDRFDTLRVINFLQDNNILIPHNLKPSRTINTLIDIEPFQEKYNALIKMASRNNLEEQRFIDAAERELHELGTDFEIGKRQNIHTSIDYKAIHFTCRQLIKYRDPFISKFYDVREIAKDIDHSGANDPMVKKLIDRIVNLDASSLTREIRFFYPYEVQIVDVDAYKINNRGEASHQDYKRSQKRTAMLRLFDPMIKFKKLTV